MSTTIKAIKNIDATDQLISRRLRVQRMISGFSQEEISHFLGITQEQFQSYESCSERIPTKILLKLAKKFRLPISYFYHQFDQEYSNISDLYETPTEYSAHIENDVTEREILLLIKAFSEIKNYQNRKKIMEIIKIIS